MARFEPFTETTPLPLRGAPEHNALDFKGELNRKDGKILRRELAKDVAAFANCDGGTILVGAYEDTTRGILGAYKPLDVQGVKEAREAYSQAVRDFCSPTPVTDAVTIVHEGGAVVAVNVWPFPGQAVGVACGDTDHSYFFPFRASLDTTFLTPEQLPMLMLPKLRYVLAHLRSIKEGEAVRYYPRNDASPRFTYEFVRVDELVNALVLAAAGGAKTGQGHTAFPLDSVISAWRGPQGWCVRIDTP